jgi:hypothetical protein
VYGLHMRDFEPGGQLDTGSVPNRIPQSLEFLEGNRAVLHSMCHSGERWCDLGVVALLHAPRTQGRYPQLGSQLDSSWVSSGGLPLASDHHAISGIGLEHSSTPGGREA